MFDELQKLGPRVLVMPLIIAVLLCCILSLAVGPIMRASLNEVPFIIVNLDEGGMTVAGNSNVGETLTENLLSGEASLVSSDEESDEEDDDATSLSIVWTEMKTEEEAVEALNGFDYYGALIIPENFTSQQMAAAVGTGEAPELTVYLNSGKNPSMASSMQTTLAAAMLAAGMTVNVEMVNDVDLGGGTMSSMLAVQMLVMPLLIMTLIVSLFVSLLFWHNDVTGLRKKNKLVAAVVQVVIAAVFSAAVAGLALCIETFAGGMTLPIGSLFLFMWGASFCVMLAFMGICNVLFPLGAFVSILIFACGMGTAMLSAEMLPKFWATWICPWVPQAHIGQALRAILYFDMAPLQSDVNALLVYAVVGVVLLVLALLVPKRNSATSEAEVVSASKVEAISAGE